jgi:hypothetical protein
MVHIWSCASADASKSVVKVVSVVTCVAEGTTTEAKLLFE